MEAINCDVRAAQPIDVDEQLGVTPARDGGSMPGAPVGPRRTASGHGYRITRMALILAIGAALTASEAAAQETRIPPVNQRVKLSGPRFGVTYLGGRIVDSLAALDIDVSPVITQFGWQWERQFYANANGPAGVTEWVLLVGGLEQGAFLPSLSWIVGVRTTGGTEFGVGPNLGPSGFALAFAGGVTRRSGGLNLPINISVVPSKLGTRLSLLGGFTMR